MHHVSYVFYTLLAATAVTWLVCSSLNYSERRDADQNSTSLTMVWRTDSLFKFNVALLGIIFSSGTIAYFVYLLWRLWRSYKEVGTSDAVTMYLKVARGLFFADFILVPAILLGTYCGIVFQWFVQKHTGEVSSVTFFLDIVGIAAVYVMFFVVFVGVQRHKLDVSSLFLYMLASAVAFSIVVHVFYSTSLDVPRTLQDGLRLSDARRAWAKAGGYLYGCFLVIEWIEATALIFWMRNKLMNAKNIGEIGWNVMGIFAITVFLKYLMVPLCFYLAQPSDGPF